MLNEHEMKSKKECFAAWGKAEEELCAFIKAFDQFGFDYIKSNKTDPMLMLLAIFIIINQGCQTLLNETGFLKIPEKFINDIGAQQVIKDFEFCEKSIDAFTELLKDFIPVFRKLVFCKCMTDDSIEKNHEEKEE